MTGMRSWTVEVHSACFKTFTWLTSTFSNFPPNRIIHLRPTLKNPF